MAWVRMSDTFANHPIVLAAVEHADADERSVDELAGYMTRLATLTAQNVTDYVVSYGTAVTLAGSISRADRLLALAEFAGWGQNVVDPASGRRAFQLVDDAEFIHMKTAEEIAFEKQRKLDNSDPHITVLVRIRDGDACRYCGRVVRFHGVRRGALAGTYDHRPPGRRATADTAVVACTSCNSGRGALSRDQSSPESGLAKADARYPLLREPTEPYYSASTRVWLQSHSKLLAQYGFKAPELAPKENDLKMGSPAPGYENAPIYRSTDPTTPVSPDTAPASAGVRPDTPEPSAADTAPIYNSVRPAANAKKHEVGTAPAPAGVRPTSASETATPDTAPIYNSVRPDPQAEGHPHSQALGQADPSRSQQIPADRMHAGSGFTGSGRVGSARHGSGLDGSTPPSQKRKRRRRGKRTRRPDHPQSSAHENNSSRGPDNG